MSGGWYGYSPSTAAPAGGRTSQRVRPRDLAADFPASLLVLPDALAASCRDVYVHTSGAVCQDGSERTYAVRVIYIDRCGDRVQVSVYAPHDDVYSHPFTREGIFHEELESPAMGGVTCRKAARLTGRLRQSGPLVVGGSAVSCLRSVYRGAVRQVVELSGAVAVITSPVGASGHDTWEIA
jgi:hypothetical protein